MTQSIINIRPATPEDLSTIVDFNYRLAEETEAKTLDRKTITGGVRRALHDSELCRYWLAEVDGEIAGQTMVTFEWSDWRNGLFWWIQSVYVASRFRRRGVFRALHNHVRTEARREEGVCGLRLYVLRKNERAIETYQNLGMTLSSYQVCEDDWSDTV